MKHLITLFIITPIIAFAQQTYVPDDNFEQALINLGYDDALDDSVLTASIATVETLSIVAKNISDLTGIEDFLALSILSCNANLITSLDVSNNTNLQMLSCPLNQIESLDLSNNINLQHLNVHHNALSALNLNNNINLKIVDCYGNNIESLDLSSNSNLISLNCSDNSPLYSLNLNNGNNNIINGIYIQDNPSLYCIQVDDSVYASSNWLLEPSYYDAQHYFSVNCTTSSLEVDELERFILSFPNPVVDELSIPFYVQAITIYNLNGAVVKKSNSHLKKINFSDLSKGMYFLEVVDELGQMYSRKIVKQ